VRIAKTSSWASTLVQWCPRPWLRTGMRNRSTTATTSTTHHISSQPPSLSGKFDPILARVRSI
jgi:hypothetical protein